MPDMTPIEALRNQIESTILSSDDSGTQILESLAMDQALATLQLAEQTAALVEQQKTANLIAASTSGWAWDSVEELDDAQTRIREAVGLPKVKGLRDRIVAELVADFKHVAEAADPVTLEGNIRAIVFSS